MACQTPTPVATLPSRDAGTVSWVYDGDTIEVSRGGQTREIRLLGINAPEDDECFHDEALDHLIETIRGHTVTYEPWGTDQFGRTLAHVWMGDTHVNLELVALGMAIATTPDQDPLGNDLLAAEMLASDEETGLWGPSVCGADGPRPTVSIDFDRYEETATVRNDGDQAIDLGGWQVRDESSRHRYRFTGGTILSPGESLTVRSGEAGWSPGEPNVWNNDGDMAMLLDESGRVVDHVRHP